MCCSSVPGLWRSDGNIVQVGVHWNEDVNEVNVWRRRASTTIGKSQAAGQPVRR